MRGSVRAERRGLSRSAKMLGMLVASGNLMIMVLFTPIGSDLIALLSSPRPRTAELLELGCDSVSIGGDRASAKHPARPWVECSSETLDCERVGQTYVEAAQPGVPFYVLVWDAGRLRCDASYGWSGELLSLDVVEKNASKRGIKERLLGK